MADNDLEELDLISAIWILACNDENHLITYEGIRERLALRAGHEVPQLVLKRRELFQALKSWQMWLVFGVGVLNIVATVIAALAKSR